VRYLAFSYLSFLHSVALMPGLYYHVLYDSDDAGGPAAGNHDGFTVLYLRALGGDFDLTIPLTRQRIVTGSGTLLCDLYDGMQAVGGLMPG
jgi:hypothetical protein